MLLILEPSLFQYVAGGWQWQILCGMRYGDFPWFAGVFELMVRTYNVNQVPAVSGNEFDKGFAVYD
jgi:hypothetical protein